MNRDYRRFVKQLWAIFVVTVLVMIAMGFVFYNYLIGVIDNMAMNKVLRDSRTAGLYYTQQLASEMMTLEHIGALLENDRPDEQAENVQRAKYVIENVFRNEPSILIGIMNGESDAVYGERVPPNEYDSLLSTMTGNKGITYMKTGAFLFSIPVLHGDNVSYVIYSVCSTAYIKKHHGLEMIKNLGNVSLMTIEGNEALPFTHLEEGDEGFFKSRSVKKVFEKLRKEHNLEPAAVTKVNTTKGKMYFYIAQIENSHFILAGAISYDEAVGDTKMVPYIVMIIYASLCIITIIQTIFTITSMIKVRESDELTRGKQVAEAAAKAKGQFLANMSHEIRTPINAIMGMDELIARETNDKNIQKYAFSIKSSANQLMAIVNDVLDFSKMEAGKFKLRSDNYYLSSVITDIDAMIKNRAESKGLTYKVFVNENIPDGLIGDDTRLKQVIINLLTNAVKYTMAGFVHFKIDFEKIDDEQIDLKVTVKDTGIGMKEAEIKKLFNAFERLDEDRNKTIEGTGLGMSIVKQILDSMGSTLDVKSKYGAGSEFSFTARQKVFSWHPIGDYSISSDKVVARQENYVPKVIAPSVRILAVDDTEINLRVVKGLLRQTRIQVDTALSGKQALDMMGASKYDLALIDHRMPVMDGVELLKHLRSDAGNQNQNIPCIALTANVVEGGREMYIKAGFNDYLEKPVNGARLEDMLMQYLPKDKLLDEVPAEESGSAGMAAGAEGIASPEGSVRAKMEAIEAQGFINIEDGISYAGSETDFIDTLQFFRDTVDKKANEIQKFYDEQNIEDYTTKVHALKSAARIIGAKDLSEKARLLEQAGKDGNLDYIKANTDEVLKEYRQYKEILERI